MTDAVAKLREIYNDFHTLVINRGEVSEGDTRANVIDRILHEVLGWGHVNVHREVNVDSKFVDYELIEGRPRVVIEAKRAGKSFTIVYKKNPPRTYKIGGILSANKELIEAIEQAQGYCNSHGIRFGVVTNGYSFIVFRAMTEGMAWKDGYARVFSGPKEIEARFAEFWDLLSYEGVTGGRLSAAFSLSPGEEREFHRPIDHAVDADACYDRNELNVGLRPYVEKFFGDIAAQDDITVLTKCYVGSVPIQVIDVGLNMAIRDRIPAFAPTAKQIDVKVGETRDNLEQDFRQKLASNPKGGSVTLIIGGIGSGKSTLLRRFFRVVANDLFTIDGPATDILVDFLGAVDTPQEVAVYMWLNLRKAITAKMPDITTRPVLETMFADSLRITREVYSTQPDRVETMVADRLFQLTSSDREFCRAALAHCRGIGKFPVVVFDNVDQLGVEPQIEIFTTAQNLARDHGCASLVVLREETYATAQMKKQLTAYNIHAYHLSSPRFRELVTARINLAMETASSEQKERLFTDQGIKTQQVMDFFTLLKQSVFDRDRSIVKLVEAVSYGNARLALDFLNLFMTAGTTNMEKILRKFASFGQYTIPFHEFAKSVILGDYRYYKDSRSRICNVFDTNSARNASHFTTLRILKYLSRAKKTKDDDEGFVGIQPLLTTLNDIFDNEDDCILTIRRLIALGRQLAELDTRRTDTLDGASAIRITASGVYYLQFFVTSFQYLDLVWHDTPFNKRSVADSLFRKMPVTDMMTRFLRIEEFLDYLDNEETVELGRTGLPPQESHLIGPFMPYIKEQYDRQKRVIGAAMRQTGREK